MLVVGMRTGSLSDSSDVLLGSGTKLSISGDEVVGSIEGGGDIELGTSTADSGWSEHR